MANKFIGGDNPLHDFLFISLIYGTDISNKKYKQEIHETLTYLLENYLDNLNDLKFLDFDIKKRNNKYTVLGKNIITALWLSGIIPDNTINVIRENKLVFRNIEYTFDDKNFELKMKKL